MKYVLGSGITGLLAKVILGDDWTVIPFYKSRFFSFNPPLCDNFLIADPQIDPVITSLGYSTIPVLYKRSYSLGGHLLPGDKNVIGDWLSKLFGPAVPAHASAYMQARHTFFVYHKVWIDKLYKQLLAKYDSELKQQASLGMITEIGDHFLVRDGKKLEYEQLVSTIPLEKLLALMGRDSSQLLYKPLHYVHLQTNHLDFEGANQTLVVDPIFSFHKVGMLAKNRYLFYFHEDVVDTGSYFMPILEDFDLLDGTKLENALICGNMPDLGWLERMSIFPVGAYAQHDYCADVSSNMLRLLRFGNRDFKPKSSLTIL